MTFEGRRGQTFKDKLVFCQPGAATRAVRTWARSFPRLSRLWFQERAFFWRAMEDTVLGSVVCEVTGVSSRGLDR